MAYCKANNCYNSTNYSWNSYCSYHENCLSKLRQYRSIDNIQELETFTTHFNGNCGYVINYEGGSYYVWVVVYEPSAKSMSENLSAIRHDSFSYLSNAQSKAQELKGKLQNDSFFDTPMLEVHPKANSYESFGYLTNSDYVKESILPYKTNFDFYDYCDCYPGCDCYHCTCTKADITRTRIADPQNHLRPLDIIKVSEGNYKHVGVYLGWIDSEYRVCNYSKNYKGTRVHTLDQFLKDYHRGDGKIVRCHPIIPFKNFRRIAEQINWTKDVDFRANNYDLLDRNCEHFANMVVYGINYSEQVQNSNLSSFIDGVCGIFGAPYRNNNKGSTIKLTNEMSESESKLSWKSDNYSEKIKRQYLQEVPPKENCRIM